MYNHIAQLRCKNLKHLAGKEDVDVKKLLDYEKVVDESKKRTQHKNTVMRVKSGRGSTVTSFFFKETNRGAQSRAPDKMLTQTFFQGIEEGRNCGLAGVSITSGNLKCPKKNHTLTLKMIGCEIKCQFFPFFSCVNRNLTSESD